MIFNKNAISFIQSPVTHNNSFILQVPNLNLKSLPSSLQYLLLGPGEQPSYEPQMRFNLPMKDNVMDGILKIQEVGVTWFCDRCRANDINQKRSLGGNPTLLLCIIKKKKFKHWLRRGPLKALKALCSLPLLRPGPFNARSALSLLHQQRRGALTNTFHCAAAQGAVTNFCFSYFYFFYLHRSYISNF